ncbi:MAG: helix-turn-helix domain-containing protein [Firmicutes bacterium]|nr:helix-turn-helix domain-containing protein [Bacillota bacterium]
MGVEITFRGIEADVCPECGEEAYAAADVEMMESLIEGTLKDESYPRLMNVEEVSSFLRVTPQTVYNMLRDGRIKATKVGREWRFPREEVVAALGLAPRLQPAFYRGGKLLEQGVGSVNETTGEYRSRLRAKRKKEQKKE